MKIAQCCEDCIYADLKNKMCVEDPFCPKPLNGLAPDGWKCKLENFSNPIKEERDLFIKMYVKLKMSVPEMAEDLGISEFSLRLKFKKYNIVRRTLSQAIIVANEKRRNK